MIERLKTLNPPALWLWLFAVAYGIAAGTKEFGELPKRAELAADIGWPLLLAFWVLRDAQRRGRDFWYDFDSFVFFAWPLLLPVYLFQTRGVRALWTILWFAAIWVFSGCVAAAVALIRS